MGTRVGVLGAGRMGLPIARRLAEAGFDVAVWDADPARRALLDGLGLPLAGDAVELAARSDVLLTVLPGAAESRDALPGPRGLLAALRPGSLWIDLTSDDPAFVAEAAVQADAAGIRVVAAPMGGGPQAAEAAELGFFVAGAADAVADARALLDALAASGGIRVVGERPAQAHTAKLLANLLWFGQAVAVSEALLLGAAQGLEPGALAEILGASAGGSAFIERHLPALLRGDYLEEFGIDRVVEELDALTALAEASGTPFELSRLVADTHRQALERFGAVGGELLGARLLEERAGRMLRAEARAQER